MLLRYVYDRLEGAPHVSASVERRDNVEVVLRWADGRVASRGNSGDIDAEYVRQLPPLRDKGVTLGDVAAELESDLAPYVRDDDD